MVVRKLILTLICFAALCLTAGPAKADLFDIHVTELDTVFDGVDTFTVSKTTSGFSFASLTGKSGSASGTAAYFIWPGIDNGDFSLSMTISGIVSTPGAESATGSGSFTFSDASSTADTITGLITGTWTRSATGQNHFSGLLSDVEFNDNSTDGAFDSGTGHGSVPMTGFAASAPWQGSAVQITASADWFGTGEFEATGGSLDAVVTAVPLPASVLFGFLGLGVAGLKLRKRM